MIRQNICGNDLRGKNTGTVQLGLKHVLKTINMPRPLSSTSSKIARTRIHPHYSKFCLSNHPQKQFVYSSRTSGTKSIPTVTALDPSPVLFHADWAADSRTEQPTCPTRGRLRQDWRRHRRPGHVTVSHEPAEMVSRHARRSGTRSVIRPVVWVCCRNACTADFTGYVMGWSRAWNLCDVLQSKRP